MRHEDKGVCARKALVQEGRGSMKLEEITRIPRVFGAGLATDDGFIVDSQFTVGYDAEKSAAMAAQIINVTMRSLTTKNASVVLYTSNSVFFIKKVDEGVFFVICQRDANLGLIKIKVDRIT
jgi:predicted regulator of Ras-like GTPase activity (Roadblock/LC7/MglB family)